MNNNILNNIMDILTNFSTKYGFFIVGGAIGSVIHRLRNKMPLKRFISSVIISIFVGLSTGVICRDYFNLTDSIAYVLCSISGVFSESILDEIQEIIKNVSNIVKAKFNNNDSLD